MTFNNKIKRIIMNDSSIILLNYIIQSIIKMKYEFLLLKKGQIIHNGLFYIISDNK